jgi:hypothetical protein
MGRLAQTELNSMHTALHAINSQPNINFSKEEIVILQKAMQFLIIQTGLAESTPEANLYKTLNTILTA